MKKTFLTATCLIALAACNEIPKEAFFNHGDPENLLDVSSETVTLSLSSQGALAELSSVLAEDMPARAELACPSGGPVCTQARELLMQHNVPVDSASGNNGDLTLYYERVVARDCENRYIDNSINPYNLYHPTFGCSVVGNMVQQVSDRRQFVNPNLLDYSDADKPAQVYRAYLKPAKNKPVTTGTSIIKGAGGVQ